MDKYKARLFMSIPNKMTFDLYELNAAGIIFDNGNHCLELIVGGQPTMVTFESKEEAEEMLKNIHDQASSLPKFS